MQNPGHSASKLPFLMVVDMLVVTSDFFQTQARVKLFSIVSTHSTFKGRSICLRHPLRQAMLRVQFLCIDLERIGR